jgi:uncharacterized protein
MAPADDSGAAGGLLPVQVVYCPGPRVVDLVSLHLAPGSTVADALRASRLLERHGLAADGLRLGVWCRACDPGAVLREHDRVEIYRPLTVDPKEARRQRYKRAKPAA